MQNNKFVKEMDSDAKKNRGRKAGKKNGKGKLLTVVVNLLAMALVAVLVPYVTLCWLDSYTNHNVAYKVPDVCGLHVDEAADVLKDSRLGYSVVEYKYKDGAVADEVLEQRPLAGAKVKEGRKITLVLNTTEKPRQGIPPVIDNSSLREAEFRLKAAGFVVEAVDTVKGEREWVYELRYNGRKLENGTAIPRGSKVTLVVGSGEDISSDTVRLDPDFF